MFLVFLWSFPGRGYRVCTCVLVMIGTVEGRWMGKLRVDGWHLEMGREVTEGVACGVAGRGVDRWRRGEGGGERVTGLCVRVCVCVCACVFSR